MQKEEKISHTTIEQLTQEFKETAIKSNKWRKINDFEKKIRWRWVKSNNSNNNDNNIQLWQRYCGGVATQSAWKSVWLLVLYLIYFPMHNLWYKVLSVCQSLLNKKHLYTFYIALNSMLWHLWHLLYRLMKSEFFNLFKLIRNNRSFSLSLLIKVTKCAM